MASTSPVRADMCKNISYLASLDVLIANYEDQIRRLQDIKTYDKVLVIDVDVAFLKESLRKYHQIRKDVRKRIAA